MTMTKTKVPIEKTDANTCAYFSLRLEPDSAKEKVHDVC
jgi:hypothetical protein